MKCWIISLVILYIVHDGYCWTTEDLELFDLVESTPQNFYDVLGVDPKASTGDIKKAYRKLSALYHPDKNKNSNAEETFRRIAAVADVLRNEERRKAYDLILKTGLPDWRVPIYYYRRVRNMGLLEMTIFLFFLATFAQYLFFWSSYWEKKYEIEEIVLSRIRKKVKNQKKSKNAIKIDEDATISEAISSLPKPRCQDLFPFRLVSFFIHLMKSSPTYLATCKEYIMKRKVVEEESEDDEPQNATKPRPRKQAKLKIPDYSNVPSYDEPEKVLYNKENTDTEIKHKQNWSWNTLTEQQILDFKKAIKKFPVGTLQRWEKVAAYLDCEVSEVVSMIKEMKNQQVSKSVPASMQGVTGIEKENFGSELYIEKDSSTKLSNGSCLNGNVASKDSQAVATCSEKIWKQEEQRSLELALQKYPKDTPARWDKIANFVSTKTKEECIERFKVIAQQIKKKKDKTV